MSWLLIATTCALLSDDCVAQRTKFESKKDCVDQAQIMQDKLDQRGDLRFVLICREVSKDTLRPMMNMWYNGHSYNEEAPK